MCLLLQYIKENTSDAKPDQPFRFTFEDSNGVLELVMDVKQQNPAPGWTVLPHAKPLTVSVIMEFTNSYQHDNPEYMYSVDSTRRHG